MRRQRSRSIRLAGMLSFAAVLVFSGWSLIPGCKQGRAPYDVMDPNGRPVDYLPPAPGGIVPGTTHQVGLLYRYDPTLYQLFVPYPGTSVRYVRRGEVLAPLGTNPYDPLLKVPDQLAPALKPIYDDPRLFGDRALEIQDARRARRVRRARPGTLEDLERARHLVAERNQSLQALLGLSGTCRLDNAALRQDLLQLHGGSRASDLEIELREPLHAIGPLSRSRDAPLALGEPLEQAQLFPFASEVLPGPGHVQLQDHVPLGDRLAVAVPHARDLEPGGVRDHAEVAGLERAPKLQAGPARVHDREALARLDGRPLLATAVREERGRERHGEDEDWDSRHGLHRLPRSRERWRRE